MADCARQIYAANGIRGFFKGFTPCMYGCVIWHQSVGLLPPSLLTTRVCLCYVVCVHSRQTQCASLATSTPFAFSINNMRAACWWLAFIAQQYNNNQAHVKRLLRFGCRFSLSCVASVVPLIVIDALQIGANNRLVFLLVCLHGIGQATGQRIVCLGIEDWKVDTKIESPIVMMRNSLPTSLVVQPTNQPTT
jgi:hypothetical protein